MNVNVVSTTYIGNQSALIESSGRTFVVDERTKMSLVDAKFCPIELIAASLGA
jgi:hypothetical protein